MVSMIPYQSSAENVYSHGDVVGVTLIVIAGTISALSAIGVFGFIGLTVGKHIREPQYLYTVPIFLSLMVGDLLQAFGSILNARWVLEGAATPGTYCSFQGGIKQAGNVSIAVWSFLTALHAFCTLFRRGQSSIRGLVLKLVLGWSFVLFIVLLGPIALHRPSKGPFLGVSGLWCWITSSYPTERIFLEYFFEFFSVAASFVLYGTILLRIRGNLFRSSEGWRLRFVPKGESWKLAVTRDSVDQAVLKAAYALMWYPVAYFFVLLPISITRFIEFAGHDVPLWAQTVTAVIFNLTGLIDALLLLRLRKFAPDPSVLPALNTVKREKVDFKSGSALRVTPFVDGLGEDGSLSRSNSISSTNSRQALV